jgi:hypothetical protein
VAATHEFDAHSAARAQLALSTFNGLHTPMAALQPLPHWAAVSHWTQPCPLLRQNVPAPQVWLQHTRAPPPAVG